ncbi:hypothetical protein C4D60_Mb06t13380 [Musa balbisiana]|uniref:Pectinesterase inhibitor domain-containing protein n=1 Tax=Musa balbisiana TaxID=52838 RepID=A0A4S8IP14_MUSBA|nr:hypothetical protein C4D60_Mb06t13380 [Musa balbisiana]
MASSPSYFFFFFFLLLLTPSLAFPPPPPSSTLIQTTCSLTSNYDFCVAALRSDPRSLRAKDVKSLSAIALRIAVAKAKTTAAYATSLAKNATEVAASRSAFGTCAEKYKNAGEALRWALGSLAQENYDYACVHIGAAQEYASTCGRLFFRRNPGMAFPAAMAKREDELQRLCGTAFDIISQLG